MLSESSIKSPFSSIPAKVMHGQRSDSSQLTQMVSSAHLSWNAAFMTRISSGCSPTSMGMSLLENVTRVLDSPLLVVSMFCGFT